jgi:hypothetical protein
MCCLCIVHHDHLRKIVARTRILWLIQPEYIYNIEFFYSLSLNTDRKLGMVYKTQHY